MKATRLAAWNQRRAAHAARYRDALDGTRIATPRSIPDRDSCWHLYVVRTAERDALRAELAQRGIETMIHYPVPPHLQPAYRDLAFREVQFPIAEALAGHALSLPCGPHLSPSDQARVIDALRSR